MHAFETITFPLSQIEGARFFLLLAVVLLALVAMASLGENPRPRGRGRKF